MCFGFGPGPRETLYSPGPGSLLEAIYHLLSRCYCKLSIQNQGNTSFCAKIQKKIRKYNILMGKTKKLKEIRGFVQKFVKNLRKYNILIRKTKIQRYLPS